MYILDSKNTKKLAVFDLSGKHIRNIGSNGEGPQDYKGLLDFTIDTENKKIIILDKQLNLML